ETAPFLTLAEITEDSLEKTFREYGIEATPGPYVDRLVSLWRQAKAYAEVPRILDALDGVPRAVVSNADHEFLLDILERNGLRFDVVVTSESAQTYKPRPRIFEAALESLRVRPSDVIRVGGGGGSAQCHRGREDSRPPLRISASRGLVRMPRRDDSGRHRERPLAEPGARRARAETTQVDGQGSRAHGPRRERPLASEG